MKQKINILLFFALVSVRVSTQHGTKGGAFGGSFSASSSSSQSSSSSSSSSSSFTATGSLNELGPGLKDLVGKLGHGGANSGSHFGAFGSAGGSNGGSLSGSASTSGTFANSGSGVGLAGINGNQGVAGSGSTSGGLGAGFSGVSCTLGKKDCGGSNNGNLNGGSQSSSVSGSSEEEKYEIDSHVPEESEPKRITTSSSGAGEIQQNSASYGSIPSISFVSQPVHVVKEKPVTENEGGSPGSWSISGTGANTIPESSGTENGIQGSTSGSYTSGSIKTGSPSQTSFSTGSQSTPSPYPSVHGNHPGAGFPVGGQQTTHVHPSSNGNPQGSDSSAGGQVPSAYPSGHWNTPVSGLPVGGQLTTSTHPSGHGSLPALGFPVGGQRPTSGYENPHGSSQPTTSYNPSSPGHQHPSSGNAPSGIYTGSQSGFNSENNFGSHHGINGHGNETPKKPCCTGVFPGPSGSIHDSKPAHLAPAIPNPGGSFSASGINTGGVFASGSGTSGVTTGGTGSKGPCCKGPFPGPNGSIHDSRPAHSIPLNPTSPGGYPPVPGVVPSNPSSGGGYEPSHTFGSPGAVPCCKKPHLPGPTGSIHESKPATSVPQEGSSGNKYNGPFPGPSGGILSSRPVIAGSTSYDASSGTQHQIHSGVKHDLTSRGQGSYIHHVAKPSIDLNPPVISGPVVVSRYPSKPTTFIDSHKPTDVPSPGYPTGTFTPQKPDESHQQEIPNSGSLISGSTGSGSGDTYGFATGTVAIQKPDGSVTGGKDLSSGNSASTSSESHTGFGGSLLTEFESRKPSTTLNPSVINKPVLTGQYPSNPGFVASGKPSIITDKPTGVSGFGYTTGYVQKLDDIQPQEKPNGDSVIYGSASSGSGNRYDYQNGFATGHVAIQKPDGSVTGGYNAPSGHSAGIASDSSAGAGGASLISTDLNNNNGHATLNVVVQKPDGSVSGNRYLLGTTGGSHVGPGSRVQITQITSGSPSGAGFGTSDSGNGYAVGGVFIQKPDGSVTTGKDSSSLGTYSSGVQSGFGHKGAAGSYTFGSSGSGAFGSAPGSDIFGLSGNGPFEGGIKGSTGFGSYAGSHASAGSFAGPAAFNGGKSGSYIAGQSGPEAGFTGLLKGLFGKHGLGGNLGVAGATSGSFSKSHSYASSASYAGSSASSYSGHY